MNANVIALWAPVGCRTLSDAAAEVAGSLRDGGASVAVVAGLEEELDRGSLAGLAQTLLVYTPEEFVSFGEGAVSNIVQLLQRRHGAVLILGAVAAGAEPPLAWLRVAPRHLVLALATQEGTEAVRSWLKVWQQAGLTLPYLLVEQAPAGTAPQAVAEALGLELLGSSEPGRSAEGEERRSRNLQRLQAIIQADRMEAQAEAAPADQEAAPEPEILGDMITAIQELASLGRRREAMEAGMAGAQVEFERLRAAVIGWLDADDDPSDAMDGQIQALVQAKARLRAARRERARLVEQIAERAERMRHWLDRITGATA